MADPDDWLIDFPDCNKLPDDPDAYWWRAYFTVMQTRGIFDLDGDWLRNERKLPEVYVGYETFAVDRKTDKGVWLADTYEPNGHLRPLRFVLRDARKRWACPTKAEALISLRARTSRRITILTAQLDKARAGYEHLSTMGGTDD